MYDINSNSNPSPHETILEHEPLFILFLVIKSFGAKFGRKRTRNNKKKKMKNTRLLFPEYWKGNPSVYTSN